MAFKSFWVEREGGGATDAVTFTGRDIVTRAASAFYRVGRTDVGTVRKRRRKTSKAQNTGNQCEIAELSSGIRTAAGYIALLKKNIPRREMRDISGH